MKQDVYNIIRDAAQQWPDHVAVYDQYGEVTFSALFAETEKLKSWLIEEGVVPGMGVSVMCRNSRFFIYALFAAVGAGAVVLPISHQMKKAEIEAIIEATGLHAILDDQSGVDPVESEPVFFEAFDFLPAFRFQRTPFLFEAPLANHLDDPVFIRYSSGTTGQSKGVVIGHHSVYERVDAANELLSLKPGDVVLWVLPMAFHFVVSIVLYLRFGAAIAIARDFLADTIIQCAKDYQAAMLYASPMHLRLISNHPGKVDINSIHTVISTSTAISPDEILRFTKKTGKPVSQAYGIIEIGLPIVNKKSAEQHPEAVGHALPAYEVAILDDSDRELEHGKVGNLAIAGPGMFDGYLEPPTKRADHLNGKWFMTGDLAMKSDDGLITIKGRKKSMINVSGNKVFPEEVEAVLNNHPDVEMCRVFGSKHPLLGEVVLAEVVTSTDCPDTEELIKFCRSQLSTYKVPQRITLVDRIEMTATGKLKR